MSAIVRGAEDLEETDTFSHVQSDLGGTTCPTLLV